MKDSYIIDPYGTKQRIANLDTLRELAVAGVIHAGTLILDEATGKMFVAGTHPYLKGKCKLAPTPPPAPPVAQPAPPLPEAFAPPSGQEYVFGEMTRQYKNLVYWQIAGLTILLDGPILLIFLFWTKLIYPVLAFSVLFPVMTAVVPLFACGGLVYALFKKPSLRHGIATMGIDSQQWARSMEHPLKVFWIASGAFTGIVVFIALIWALTHPGELRGEPINQRTSPTLYEYEYQRRGY